MNGRPPAAAGATGKPWPFGGRVKSAAPSSAARLSDSLCFGPGLDIAARSSASISALHVPENQDNLLLIDATGHAVWLHDQAERGMVLPDWPAGHVRLAVLDGMGGHGHGREAAQAVAAGLLAIPACDGVEQLSARLDQLHTTLQARFRSAGDNDSFRRPGTTLTLLEIPPGQDALLYHVGDSRLYEVTPAGATPLTVDHVPATSYAMHGLLGRQEWWQQVHAEHRAQISQAFILGNAFVNPQLLDDALHRLDQANLPPFLAHLPDRRALRLRHDAVYLLATDGFWACAEPLRWSAQWPQLLGQNRPAGAALAQLFDSFGAAPPPGLHIDNLSAIVLRVAAPAANGDDSDDDSSKDSGADNVDETALPAPGFQPFY